MMANQNLSNLTNQELKNLVEKIGETLLEFEIDTEVKVIRQCKIPLKDIKVENTVNIIVDKYLDAKFSQNIDKFNEKIKDIVQNFEGIEVNVKIDIDIGSQYETIKNVVPLNEDSTVNLEHKQGEVWLVDFWATWCPPCQEPMAHNQEMLQKRQEEWGDKIRIIGVSDDKEKSILKDHVNQKGWTKVEHYWKDKSDCRKQYNVKRIPRFLLIDQNGKIAFKGHPWRRQNVEQDLDDLLSGKEIAESQAEQIEEQEKIELSQDQVESYNKEIDSFAEHASKLQQNENLKTQCQFLEEALSIVTLEQFYDPKSQKQIGTYNNVRYLKGPQTNIDEVFELLKGEMSGSYQVQQRSWAI